MATPRAPHVVAAGHKHIPAPKSGTSFPAFLIGGLPDLDPPAATATAGQDTRTTHRPPRWRTKRDHLLLSRAAKSSATSKGHGGEFPKAIYKKLADKAASCPWVFPIDDGTTGRTEDEQDSVLALKKHENGWKPEMTKSVRRLDSFLAECAEIYQHAVSESIDLPIIQGWKEFCRPNDTEGLVDCDDQVQSTNSDGQVPSSAGTKRPLAQDSSSLPTDPTKRAASLGQYFASDENAAAVVECAIELAKKAISRNEESNNRKPLSIVFIETSAGDGRIVECLMEHLRLKSIDAAYVGCVLGFDIDGRAVEACRTRMRQCRDCAGLPPLLVQQADFLKLTKCEVQQLVADACKGQKHDNTAVICLGGPPYSLGPLTRDDGAGNNESSQRGLDLPEQFLRRCMIDLECSGISFLLPERSGEDAEALSQDLPSGWKYNNITLAESSFDFRGKMVIQPSILQCWEKE